MFYCWSVAFPDYAERMWQMRHPASVSMAKRNANLLTLVPKE